MAVTAYKFAGTTATVARTDNEPWTTTDNAKADDGNYAENSIAKNNVSDWLRVTNFSMGVPAGSTIDGIEVQIERTTDSGQDARDSAVYLRKSVGQVGDNYADVNLYAFTDEVITYGGATDLWNTTWNVTDVNSSDFGLDLSTLADGENVSPDIDYIKIRVHYTEGAPAGTNISINIADTFKDVDSMQINIGDVWKDVVEVQQNIGDAWKTVF